MDRTGNKRVYPKAFGRPVVSQYETLNKTPAPLKTEEHVLQKTFHALHIGQQVHSKFSHILRSNQKPFMHASGKALYAYALSVSDMVNQGRSTGSAGDLLVCEETLVSSNGPCGFLSHVCFEFGKVLLFALHQKREKNGRSTDDLPKSIHIVSASRAGADFGGPPTDGHTFVIIGDRDDPYSVVIDLWPMFPKLHLLRDNKFGITTVDKSYTYNPKEKDKIDPGVAWKEMEDRVAWRRDNGDGDIPEFETSEYQEKNDMNSYAWNCLHAHVDNAPHYIYINSHGERIDPDFVDAPSLNQAILAYQIANEFARPLVGLPKLEYPYPLSPFRAESVNDGDNNQQSSELSDEEISEHNDRSVDDDSNDGETFEELKHALTIVSHALESRQHMDDSSDFDDSSDSSSSYSSMSEEE
ncbi:MAG TPA: hypothetical protein VK832_09770 [Burkholderiaceae bacterium]|jgi:hypothetical protein|nr:hypothetical protein [Burkholderiaceae bacterium]